jgi:hypothetical protein
MVNIVCIKYGRYYSPVYVNRLYAGVRRHLLRPFRFVCVTNDPAGIRPEVECVPFMENQNVPGRKWPNIFSKLTLFKDGFADLEGPTLYLDLDTLIMGPLDRFFDYRPGEFCIIHNWIEFYKRIFRKAPQIGNSSCFRFEAGASNAVYEFFLREKDDPTKRHLFANGSQKLQTRAMFSAGKVNWWPTDWVCSFKRQCIPPVPLNRFLEPRQPKGASVIAFHGHPDIPEAQAGYLFRDQKGVRVPVKFHLTCQPAPWIDALWRE